jgi:alpha-L-rhamnosidase
VSKALRQRASWIAPNDVQVDLAATMAAFFEGKRPALSSQRNGFYYLRKTFDLSSPPSEALARISADGRYRLYVNGVYAGRGPARCDPAFQSYDERDIAPHLRAGRNVIAVLLHSYGRDMSWYQLPPAVHLAAFGCASVFFQADLALIDETLLQIDSDGLWRWLKAGAWRQDTKVGSVGFEEVFDAREAPQGWTSPEFDDSGWQPVRVLEAPSLNLATPMRPFPHMVPRAIPDLFERELLPGALLFAGEVEGQESGSPTEQATGESLVESGAERIENAKALLSGGEAKIGPGKRDFSLVFDFEDTVAGYPRLEITAPAGAVIDVAYSERLRGLRPEPPPPGPVTSPHAHRYVTREGRQTWEKFEWAGFRYLQLTVRRQTGPVTLHRVTLNETGYPVEERGSFECSDELLNRIWRAGAKTVRRCMHDGYEDCPSREQRQWLGDLYTESLTNYAAFGDTRLVAQALRVAAQTQRSDGMVPMATPGDLAARHGLAIPDWGLYWVLSLGRYVEYTGDLVPAVEVFPAVLRLLDWFGRFVDGDGLLNGLPEWNFIDWAGVDRRGECTAMNALYQRALRVAADLARRLEMPRVADGLAKRAESIASAINAHLWDEHAGVYVDSRLDGQRSHRISQQSNAAVIAYGVAPGERWDSIFATILDDSRLVLTPTGMIGLAAETAVPFDEERDVVVAQPFFSHHLHRALARAGRYGDLLHNIRSRWGEMLAGGVTTIWEVWHPNVSKCHGWSTTPTFDLSTEALGVVPLEPGFTRFRVAPHPVDLEWAKGVFPTVRGDIPVSWRRTQDTFELDVEAPPETTVEIILPQRPGGWRKVEVNGTPAGPNAPLVVAGPAKVSVVART